MDDRLHLEVKTDTASYTHAFARIRGFLDGRPLTPETAYAVTLAFEEVVTNVMKYSHEDQETHEVEVEVTVQPGRATLEVIDDGREFDPLAAPAPNIDAPIENREIGALGIHLIRELATKLTYERRSAKNVLTMVFEDGAAEGG